MCKGLREMGVPERYGLNPFGAKASGVPLRLCFDLLVGPS